MNGGMKKILVVDDEPSIRKFLRLSLEVQNYLIFEAENGRQCLQDVIARRPDAVVLDLGLPDISGQEVIRILREWTNTPIVVLTVCNADEDKVQALDLGADHYLTKPFSVPELLARLRAALRHAHPEMLTPLFKSGPLEIDRDGRIVRMAGEVIKLTSTEYDLLSLLSRHAGKVLSHRMLLKEIWGPNSTEHTQYLRVYLGQIRKKLQVKSDLPELIITEPGVGYRLLLH